MKLRVALAGVLVAPAALVASGAAAPSYAASTCQGHLATIEGTGGILTGTERADVIVSHGRDTEVRALGGNDLICVEGGDVSTGAGDDSVVSTAPAGTLTSVYLVGGSDSYVGGAGGSDVVADE